MDTNWGQIGGMLGGAAMQGLGSYFGAKESAAAAENAARIQAQATRRAQEQAQAYQEKQFGVAQGLMDPYMQMGAGALGQFQDFNVGGVGGDILGQMSGLAEAGLGTDYQADPAYQWRLAQAEEQAQRQMASMGGLESRLGLDVVGDRAMALSGEEADKQYLRSVDEYNRLYGNLEKQYGYQYGGLTDQLKFGYGATRDLAGMAQGLGGAVGGQIMGGGLSSAGMSADLMAQAGQTMGAGYAGLGASLGDMMGTYAMREPISDILSGFGQRAPETTYGGGGWGTTGKKQSPYSLMGDMNMGQYNVMQPTQY